MNLVYVSLHSEGQAGWQMVVLKESFATDGIIYWIARRSAPRRVGEMAVS